MFELTPEEIKNIEMRWKSDVDSKLDELLRCERERSCKYDTFIDMMIQREEDRADLRKAIIQKTLGGLVLAGVLGMFGLIWAGVKTESREILEALNTLLKKP